MLIIVKQSPMGYPGIQQNNVFYFVLIGSNKRDYLSTLYFLSAKQRFAQGEGLVGTAQVPAYQYWYGSTSITGLTRRVLSCS